MEQVAGRSRWAGGTREALLAVLLLLLPGVAALGGEVETHVLDLRTKADRGAHAIVFCAAEGPVDHAVAVLLRREVESEKREVRAFGLFPRDEGLGVPTAHVGELDGPAAERLMNGELAPATLRVVTQVDAKVLDQAWAVVERWEVRAALGLTTRDATEFLHEIATVAGMRPPRGAVSPARLIRDLGSPDGSRPEDSPQSTPEPPARPQVSVADRIVLPRLGTLGALPPADETIVVDIGGDGRTLLDGEGPMSLRAMRDRLDRRSKGPDWLDEDGSSRWNLLIRADATVPWVLPMWIVEMAASKQLAFYRIYFAARPRVGDAVGALRCELPSPAQAAEPGNGTADIRTVPLEVALDGAPPSDPDALYLPLLLVRGEPGERARLDLGVRLPAGDALPTGYVLQVMDVVRLADFRELALQGANGPSEAVRRSEAWLRRRVSELKAVPGTPTIRLRGRAIGRWRSDAEAPPEHGLLHIEYGFRNPERTRARARRAAKRAPRDAPFTGPAGNGRIGLGGGVGGADPPALPSRAEVGNLGSRHQAVLRALERALAWLAAHQAPDGGWRAAAFDRWCEGRPNSEPLAGHGKAIYDVGVTGLALSAFLGAGYTDRGAHPHAEKVARGLRYLRSVQDAKGCFGLRTVGHFVYNHATATLAMVEAYGLTGSLLCRDSAQRGLDFIERCRNPYFAWRYGVKAGDNDTSITGWMAAAVLAARRVNEGAAAQGRKEPLTIETDALEGIRAWLVKMTDPEFGRVGYIQRGGQPARPQELLDRFPGDMSEAMTAVGVATRLLMGDDPEEDRTLERGIQLLRVVPPWWNPRDGSIDMVYWYYGSLAMYEVGGSHWKTWRDRLFDALLDNQRKGTGSCRYEGSWDPIGPWGPDGGRVYSTAILALSLETTRRNERVERR